MKASALKEKGNKQQTRHSKWVLCFSEKTNSRCLCIVYLLSFAQCRLRDSISHVELRLPISNVGVRISAVFPRKQRVSALVVHCLRRSSSHLFAGLGLSRILSLLLKTLSRTLFSPLAELRTSPFFTLFSAGTLFGWNTLRLEHSSAVLAIHHAQYHHDRNLEQPVLVMMLAVENFIASSHVNRNPVSDKSAVGEMWFMYLKPLFFIGHGAKWPQELLYSGCGKKIPHKTSDLHLAHTDSS